MFADMDIALVFHFSKSPKLLIQMIIFQSKLKFSGFWNQMEFNFITLNKLKLIS